MSDQMIEECQIFVRRVLADRYPDELGTFELDADDLLKEIADEKPLADLQRNASGAAGFGPELLAAATVGAAGLKYVLLAWSTYKAIREIRARIAESKAPAAKPDMSHWVSSLQEAGMSRADAEALAEQFRQEFLAAVTNSLPRP
jgi:hypothetical protein